MCNVLSGYRDAFCNISNPGVTVSDGDKHSRLVSNQWWIQDFLCGGHQLPTRPLVCATVNSDHHHFIAGGDPCILSEKRDYQLFMSSVGGSI